MKKLNEISKNEWITGIIILIFGILAAISFKSNWNYLWGTSFLLIVFVTSFFKKEKDFGNKIFIICLSLFLLLAIILTLFQLKAIEVNFLAISFLIFIGIIFLGGILVWAKILFSAKKFKVLIISYTIIVGLSIILFAGIYASFDDIDYKGSPLEKNEYSIFNYIHFSANTFYSMNYGNFAPMKNSRIVSIVQLYLSYLFHVLIIAWWFSKNHSQNKKIK